MKKLFSTLYLFFTSTLVFAQEQTSAVAPIDSLTDVAVQQFDTAKNLINLLIEFIVKYSFQVVGGVIVLILGWMAANFVANLITRLLKTKNIDVTVTKFLVGGIKIIVITFAGIVALGKFGIEIAPLIAGISVIGFGTSFALQGPLSNYAAGITLIFTKPFKVGDIVEAAGQMGEVTDIKLPRTEMRTVDGNLVVIPNNHIIGEVIENFSNAKRLDLMFGVAYDSNIDQAIQIIESVIAADQDVNQEKLPKVGISEFADSSVNIMARLWCPQANYYDVKFRVNRKVFEEFAKAKIEIPFPQRDVHIKNNT